MNYENVLERFKYPSDNEIFERIDSVDEKDYRENKDIINEIILWKINRMPIVENELIDLIYDLPKDLTVYSLMDDDNVKNVLNKLLNTHGIALPVASSILHFYYPNLFPIIDQRAYRELYGKEYPKTKSKGKLINIYLTYIQDIYALNRGKYPNVSYQNIDKLLYQLDKEKGNKVVY